MKEIWKPAQYIYKDGTKVDLSDKLNVSNLGRIEILNYYGSGFSKITDFSKQVKDKYKQQGIYDNETGEIRHYMVYRIVLSTFLPISNTYECINHKDENPENNFVYIDENGNYVPELSNLEWCTQKHNANWGTRNDKIKENHINGKHSKKIVRIEPNGNQTLFICAADCERITGLNRHSITRCCRGLRKTYNGCQWKYV